MRRYLFEPALNVKEILFCRNSSMKWRTRHKYPGFQPIFKAISQFCPEKRLLLDTLPFFEASVPHSLNIELIISTTFFGTLIAISNDKEKQ